MKIPLSELEWKNEFKNKNIYEVLSSEGGISCIYFDKDNCINRDFDSSAIDNKLKRDVALGAADQVAWAIAPWVEGTIHCNNGKSYRIEVFLAGHRTGNVLFGYQLK